MAEPIITLESVNFSYADQVVLEGISLAIEQGEFLGIVGPNAGGKSTLLKVILGLLEPDRGKVRVLGKKPRSASRYLGYVSQYPQFPRDFPVTVEQVVLMGRLKPGIGIGRYTRADREAVEQALIEVEADGLLRRQIGSLSGGQLQRVLVARALVSEPAVLILDEPTSNIDQRLEGEIFDLLKRLNERMTILVVSHDIAFISSYVSRVACINRTLVCHRTDEIDGDVITSLYGDHVRMIAHSH